MSVRAWLGWLFASLVAAAAFGTAAAAKDEAPFPIAFGGPFELVDQTGRVRRDTDFHGRFLLITFGYSHCPGVCPTSLQTIAMVLDALGSQTKKLAAAFVSIDPARDRPKELGSYLAAFHPKLLGLTGSEGQIAAVAKAYKLHRRKIIPPDTEPAGGYLVDHGSLIYLMGRNGKFVTLFPFATTPERMTRTIRKYLAHAES
jgi:protein SCO1/2